MGKIVKIIVIWCMTAAIVSAQKAETIVENATKAYAQSNGISARIAVNSRMEKQGVAESFEGTVEMKEDRFVLKTPDMLAWYDGKTLWTYMLRTEEVNITDPSGDDLVLTNPMILLRTYRKGFNVSYAGESTSGNGRTADDILLTAKGKNEIETIELQIERATSLPSRMAVTFKNGLRTDIRITQMKTGLNQPDETFTFRPSDYPDAIEIDLR